MKSFAYPAAALLIMLLGVSVWAPQRTDAAGSAHAYFDALVGRGDHWKSYSLRPRAGEPIGSADYERQLNHPKDGGYANSNSGDLTVSYDPARDADPNRQDAAKVVIPAFASITTLARAIDAWQTTIPLTVASSSLLSNGRELKIDSEIMTVVRVSGVALTGNEVTVVRAQDATAAATHSAGAGVSTSQNSLSNQLRLPLGTADGNTYLFTWDGYWTSSYLATGLTNHKAFQFTSGGDGIWLETQTRFDGGGSLGTCTGWSSSSYVAGVEMRSYNAIINANSNWSLTSGNDLGPGTTNKEPIGPKAGSFCAAPNRWTRFWVRIEQRPNDYDYMDMWVADETRDPVQIYRHIPISVRPTGSPGNSIDKFWLEFNTSSTGFVRGDSRDLVAYVRNFVALMNPPADVSPLLLRPLGGVPPAYTGPPPMVAARPPANVRILR